MKLNEVLVSKRQSLTLSKSSVKKTRHDYYLEVKEEIIKSYNGALECFNRSLTSKDDSEKCELNLQEEAYANDIAYSLICLDVLFKFTLKIKDSKSSGLLDIYVDSYDPLYFSPGSIYKAESQLLKIVSEQKIPRRLNLLHLISLSCALPSIIKERRSTINVLEQRIQRSYKEYSCPLLAKRRISQLNTLRSKAIDRLAILKYAKVIIGKMEQSYFSVNNIV